MPRFLFIVFLYCSVTACAQKAPTFTDDFKNGSRVTIPALTPDVIKHIEVLGKVWGYAKYYHPAVAKGLYNWDDELFRIMPAVLDSKTPEERNRRLSAWLEGLGEVKPGKPYKPGRETVLMPDLDWTGNESELGKDLCAQLQRIRYADRPAVGYYIGFAPGTGNAVFSNERNYAEMQYPDAGYRLLSLYRFWNIVQYYSPYRKHMDENWNTVLPAMIPVFAAAKDTVAYQVAVMQLAAKVQDAHSAIWGKYVGLERLFGEQYVPFYVKFIEGKLVVAQVFTDSTDIRKGDVILRVNGETVEKKLARLKPYIGASNEQTYLRNVAFRVLQTNAPEFDLQYERNGQVHTTRIAGRSVTAVQQLSARHALPKDTSWKLLAGDIGYIYPGTISNKYIPQMMAAFKNTKGIVIDMRCYPAEFIPYTLGAHLVPGRQGFAKLTRPQPELPGLFTMMAPLQVGNRRRDLYKGKIVIILNETTQSQAEFTTMAFQQAPGAVTLGTPTAGADGNVSDVVLPGGMKLWITGLGVYYPDGKETQRIGLTPDIPVTPTVKGFREGRDEMLDKAIEVIRKS